MCLQFRSVKEPSKNHYIWVRVLFGSWQNVGSGSVRSCWVRIISHLYSNSLLLCPLSVVHRLFKDELDVFAVRANTPKVIGSDQCDWPRTAVACVQRSSCRFHLPLLRAYIILTNKAICLHAAPLQLTSGWEGNIRWYVSTYKQPSRSLAELVTVIQSCIAICPGNCNGGTTWVSAIAIHIYLYIYS